ncbi:MAG: hypothetical protein ABSF79_09790 [Smithellaceae bacterium]|jgi:ribonuclease BN (tRNA processing enzyme)
MRGGLNYQAYLDFSCGADLLIHDAEFTAEEYKHTRGWGHSLYTDALHLALDAGVKKFGLFHHNQERFDNGIDTIVVDCRKIISQSKKDLECFAVSQSMELTL